MGIESNSHMERGRTGHGRPGLSRWIVTGAVAAVTLVGAGAAVSLAGPFGGSWHWGAGPGAFAALRLERMLDGVDATSEQRTRIREIVAGAARDLEGARDSVRDTRGDTVRILAAPQVDRSAAERLRAEKLGLADGVSRRLVAALLDVAEVLTPEQRARLRDRMAERGWRPHFWR